MYFYLKYYFWWNDFKGSPGVTESFVLLCGERLTEVGHNKYEFGCMKLNALYDLNEICYII